MTDTLVPPIESHLPDFIAFVDHIVEETARGQLSTWSSIADQVQLFFTPLMMDQVDTKIAGWRQMASYADNVTLIHVVLVFTALLLCPEYQNATTEQQALIKWIVLFHDLGKIVLHGKRDSTHGFRSAVLTAQQLPRLGFTKTANFAASIEEWSTFTMQAIMLHPETHEPMQDNRQLPKIIAGIDTLFGHNTPPALIVKTVLLHMSITVVKAWPQVAPLTEQECREYLDSDVLPLLKMMMLVDNDAWSFFDASGKAQSRAEVLAVVAPLLATTRQIKIWKKARQDGFVELEATLEKVKASSKKAKIAAVRTIHLACSAEFCKFNTKSH